MSVSPLEHQTDELAIIYCELSILADLLECRANKIRDAEQDDPLYFVVSEMRHIRDRLEQMESDINVYRLCPGRKAS